MSFRIGVFTLSPRAALGLGACAVVGLLLLVLSLGIGAGAARPSATSSPAVAAPAGSAYLAGTYEASPTTGNAEAPALGAPDLDWTYQMASLSVKLLLVLAVIWVAAALYRRLVGGSVRTARRRPVIDVVESKRLAQNQAIHVVKVGGRVLVVGSTQSSMTVLSDLTGDPALEAPADEPVPAAPLPFSAYLQPLLDRAETVRVSAQGSDFVRRICNRL